MTKEERKILDDLYKQFKYYEEKCIERMDFLTSHNFNFESHVEQIKQQAYHDCAMRICFALDDIDKLNKDKND